MNKTININLGGIFFHIDEEAFQKLKRYLDAIRRSLSDDPQGRDEIIKDIESRISELLSERVNDPRQVISQTDIDEVIAIMGQPEDYMVDEELFTDDSGTNYRSKSSKKKLFRDGDDKFLGGVASGMAHYFEVDVIWIRIAWLVATFGLGFGPLVYIILWILLPEAKTTADKLQMEGEPVNISNIERKIRAEFEDASDRVKDAVGTVSDAVKEGYENVSDSLKKKDVKRSQSRAKSGLQDFIETIGKIITAFFMVIGKFIGVIVLLVSIAALIALIIFLFTAGTMDFMGADSFFDGNIQVLNVTGFPIWLISLIVLILVGIPLFMFFILGLFILSNKPKILSRTTKLVFLSIWIIALLGAIYLGVKQGVEFTNEGSSIEKIDILVQANDTINIKMIDDEILSYNREFNHHTFFRKVLDANDNTKFYSNNINFYINKTDSTNSYIKVVKKASGRTRLIARENAEQIAYDFEQSGTNLLLDCYFLMDNDNAFRNQDLNITLYVPENQIVYLDETTRFYLRHANTTKHMYTGDMPEHYFRMTDKGLACLDCPPPKDESTNENEEIQKDGVNINVNKDSLKIEIKDNDEKVEIKLDENGVVIK